MTKQKAKFQEDRGYTKEDWDSVSDEHVSTAEQLAQAKPFAEALPALAESIKRSRGRPRVAEPLEAVTLRLPPATVERFKVKGPNWRAAMAEALAKG